MSKRAKHINLEEITTKGVYVVIGEPLIVYKKAKDGLDEYVLKCHLPVGTEFVVCEGRRDFVIWAWGSEENGLLMQKYRANQMIAISYKKLDYYSNYVHKKWQTSKNKEFGGSLYGSDHLYKVGKVSKPHRFVKTTISHCKPGLHFFLCEEEARYF